MTFNSAHVIADALHSVPNGVEVVVVDNASRDETLRIAAHHGARCIANSENLGFGAGCNAGARAASGEFVLFLNPDARLRPNAINSILDAAVRYPEAAAFGPALIGADGVPGFRLESFLHPLATQAPVAQPDAECCWPFLVGAAFMCRLEAFFQVGGFDENMFLFYEEDDLFKRLRQAGWSVVCVPQAEVDHIPGHSAPPGFGLERLRQFHWIQSHAYVAAKHGLSFDAEHERRRAWRRLVLGVLQWDSKRLGGGLGRLEGLRALAQTGAPALNAPRES